MIKHEHKSVLIIDDTVLKKSRSKKGGVKSFQYSGNEHAVVLGTGVVNCVYHDIDDNSLVPVDFRIYAPCDDGKTKNDHFRDMINLSAKRGLKPDVVVADSWYSSLNNLKTLKNHGRDWVIGFKKIELLIRIKN